MPTVLPNVPLRLMPGPGIYPQATEGGGVSSASQVRGISIPGLKPAKGLPGAALLVLGPAVALPTDPGDKGGLPPGATPGAGPWAAAAAGATAAPAKPGAWSVDESGASYPNPLMKWLPADIGVKYAVPISVGVLIIILGGFFIVSGKGATIVQEVKSNADSD